MKNSLPLLLLLSLLSFIGCMPENIATETELLENDFFSPCNSISAAENIVIRNQGEYEAYFRTMNPEALIEKLPQIDFSKKSLIGTYAEQTCIKSHLKELERQGKDILYTITMTGSGQCESLYVSMNWALTPKIREKTKVTFVVTK